MTIKRRLMLFLAVLGGVVAGVAAVAALATGARPDDPPLVPPATVPASQLAQFAVLRAASAVDPGAAASAFAQRPAVAERFAPNAALARAVVPAGGDPAQPWFLLPGDGSLCLSAGAIGSCASEADALAGRLMAFKTDLAIDAGGTETWEGAGQVRILGVAADDVELVRAVDEDGETIQTTVADNVYALEGTRLVRLELVREDASTVTLPLR
jgi:hypothetical protein